MGIFAGYGKDTNAYIVYIQESNTITTSGDVYFPREDSYGDLLVDSDEQDVLDPERSTEGVDGRAEADPLLSTNFDDTLGGPQIL